MFLPTPGRRRGGDAGETRLMTLASPRSSPHVARGGGKPAVTLHPLSPSGGGSPPVFSPTLNLLRFFISAWKVILIRRVLLAMCTLSIKRLDCRYGHGPLSLHDQRIQIAVAHAGGMMAQLAD